MATPIEGSSKHFVVAEFGPSFFRRLDLTNASQLADVLNRTAEKDPQLHFNSSLIYKHAANHSTSFDARALSGPATDQLIHQFADEVVREANGSNLLMVSIWADVWNVLERYKARSYHSGRRAQRRGKLVFIHQREGQRTYSRLTPHPFRKAVTRNSCAVHLALGVRPISVLPKFLLGPLSASP